MGAGTEFTVDAEESAWLDCIARIVRVGTARDEEETGGEMFLSGRARLTPYTPGVDESDTAELKRCARRLAAAGAVGASVAHELRNALAVAESALFLARRDLDERTRVLRHLDQVSAELRKAHNIIGSVLGLARGEPVPCEAAVVRKLIDAARHALVLPCNVTFESAIEPADLTLVCNPILLERVLSNLYLNAIEAIGLDGRGSIHTRAWLGDGRVYLEVEDDGPGIAPAIKARLFEPLVTDKPQGTGLGLTLSRAIIEAHGGEITSQGERGRGATFQMWLPGGERPKPPVGILPTHAD